MFDFRNYQWYHWLLLTAFIVSLYWFWVLYLFIALVCMGAGGTHSSRNRARARSTGYKPRLFRTQRTKPYRAPRVKKPRTYKGRWLKNGTYSTYDPVRKQWRNQARHSTWKSPPD